MDNSFTNWISSHALISSTDDIDEEPETNRDFLPRAYQSRVFDFQSELNSLNQLAKLYRPVPVYGTGPISDDEKYEILRRNLGNPEADAEAIDED